MTVSRHEDLSLRYILSVPSGQADTEEMPLVVVMHGRGADANDLADLAPMIDVEPGCRFVFPNAPRPFEAYPGMTFGWSWFDGWPPQGSSFGESRQLVLTFLDEITKRYPTSATVLAGFSQGGLMALDAGFRTKEPLAGIICMSGALHEADLPDLKARREQKVLLVHGTGDDVIPVLAARRARLLLGEQGIDADYYEFPMGHNVTQESMAVVREFVARALLPQSSR
ncbi:MAG TPA: PHB depolymerase family esterase [Thermoanaerobaculia bacterium]